MILEGHIGTGEERTIIIEKEDVNLFYSLLTNFSLSDFVFCANMNNPSDNVITGDSGGRRMDLIIQIHDYERKLIITDEDYSKRIPKKYEMDTRHKCRTFDKFYNIFKEWIEEIQKTEGFNDFGMTDIIIKFKENE